MHDLGRRRGVGRPVENGAYEAASWLSVEVLVQWHRLKRRHTCRVESPPALGVPPAPPKCWGVHGPAQQCAKKGAPNTMSFLLLAWNWNDFLPPAKHACVHVCGS